MGIIKEFFFHIPICCCFFFIAYSEKKTITIIQARLLFMLRTNEIMTLLIFRSPKHLLAKPNHVNENTEKQNESRNN